MSRAAATPLRRAAVLGAGVMGAQIAAHLANVGVAVDLLDVVDPAGSGRERSRPARLAVERLAAMNPPPLFLPRCAERIRPGNFDDDMGRLADADWVIEAIVEDAATKRDLWRRAAAAAGGSALLSTNTSGLSVADIAAALPASARPRFLGTHFFNPPRYLRLVEVVPAPDTDPAYLEQARRWLERDLGKGVVVARDTPNFIANRLGGFALHATLAAMEEFGLRPEEVDALTGTLIGHPRSATFRTLDVVGLDTAVRVADHLAARLEDPRERAAFALPDFVRRMVERGMVGDKAGGGFYRRVEGSGERWVVDPATLTYRPPAPARYPSLERARAVADLGERLRLLTRADDVAGRFVWTILKRILLYSAERAEEVAGGDLAAVDRAMRWGYGWRLGPFETWAALGLAETVARVEAEGEEVPAFVRAAAAAGRQRLYEGDAEPAAAVHLFGRDVVWRAPAATLTDLGEGVACLWVTPAKAAIGPELIELIHRTAREVERGWRGLVLAAPEAERMLVGANLMLLLAAAQAGDFAAIEQNVTALQTAYRELKYLPRPVVAAPAGLTLGGGAELCLHADRVVAAAELYMGQVEAGAGLVPAGGGTKELWARALAALPEDLPWAPALAASAPTAGVGSAAFVDPAPFALRVMQTVALARVSRSAAEAQAMGLLTARDEVVLNPDDRVAAARRAVIALDEAGYHPPDPLVLPAPGREVEGLLSVAVDALVRSGRASEHDARVARAFAHVLCGGGAAMGTPLEEERWLELEREAFLRLCGDPRTQARMEHLLRTGRPLRN
ncbi:MAG: 3-hydroxyacyl-CoA dehydrogenase [Firmicutes bacterium]|nr:3-hydroxyacyl-CoA dehydrogenase [Bacillota bacterium]